MFLSATIINYLNDNSGAFTTLLILVLILVFTGYVLLNWRIVDAMERARRQALLPKLALDFHGISGRSRGRSRRRPRRHGGRPAPEASPPSPRGRGW
jgi:hypothetical protein